MFPVYVPYNEGLNSIKVFSITTVNIKNLPYFPYFIRKYKLMVSHLCVHVSVPPQPNNLQTKCQILMKGHITFVLF